MRKSVPAFFLWLFTSPTVVVALPIGVEVVVVIEVVNAQEAAQ